MSLALKDPPLEKKPGCHKQLLGSTLNEWGEGPMEAAQLSTPTTTSNSVYGNGKTSSLCSILRCVGILGRRDVELNMFAQASILKNGVEGVLAGHARIRPTTVGRK